MFSHIVKKFITSKRKSEISKSENENMQVNAQNTNET